MLRKKGTLARMLTCCLALLMLVCVPIYGIGEASAPNPIAETDYTVHWYFDGDGPQNDVELIEEEFNRYMKEELNSNLKIKLIEYDWGSYVEKMNAMMMSGEYFDLCYAADWALPWNSNIPSGVWLPWDDYIGLVPEYAEMVGPYLSNIKHKGEDNVARNYLMPTMKEFASQSGLVFNKTAAEACGILDDLYNVKTLDELPPLFDKYLEQFPEGIPFVATSSALLTYYGHSFGAGGWFDNDQDKYVIGFETPMFDEYIATNRAWYEAGYIPEYEQTTQNDLLFNMHGTCSFLVWFSSVKPGFEEERNPKNLIDYGWEFGTTPITQPVTTIKSILGNATALSRTSKNPEAAAYLYELVCTNEYLTNLINFGIEDLHYTKDAEGAIAPVENSQYWPGLNWYLGNRYLNYPLQGEPTNLGELYEEFNNSAIVLNNDGFVMDVDAYDSTLVVSVANNLRTQYDIRMQCGTITDAELQDYKDKYYAAGVREYVDAQNVEYEKWKAENGK